MCGMMKISFKKGLFFAFLCKFIEAKGQISFFKCVDGMKSHSSWYQFQIPLSVISGESANWCSKWQKGCQVWIGLKEKKSLILPVKSRRIKAIPRTSKPSLSNDFWKIQQQISKYVLQERENVHRASILMLTKSLWNHNSKREWEEGRNEN